MLENPSLLSFRCEFIQHNSDISKVQALYVGTHGQTEGEQKRGFLQLSETGTVPVVFKVFDSIIFAIFSFANFNSTQSLCILL